MSSFLCFICHSTVNWDTKEETREKYREVVGMNLCPDSQLCYICHHLLNKLWLFKSVCLKRSLEYPVLFTEKGTLNLRRNDIESIIICSEESCIPNNKQLYVDNRDQSINSNDYCKIDHDRHDYEDYFPRSTIPESINLMSEDMTIDKRNNEDYRNSDRDFDVTQRDFVNEEFDNNDIPFKNNEPQFENTDNVLEKVDGYVDNNVFPRSNDGNIMFDFELNNDQEVELETKVQSEPDNVGDDEYYDEMQSECLNEIRHEENLNEETIEELDTPKNKSKSKKRKKKEFQKMVLSFEEQKIELEAQRKGKKYVEAEFKCHNCAVGFLFKDTYQAHMMRHEESNGEYLCVLCSLRFATGAVLRLHAAQHSVRYRCTRCTKYIRMRQTQTHAKYCHGKASEAACHLCGRVFQDASGLQQHLKRFHSTKTSNRTYSCSVCGKTYNNQAAVRTHMIKHIHRKFSCDQCSSTFSSPYTLTQHKKKHTTIDNDKQHYCTTCGVGYTSRKSLLAHKRNSVNHQQRAYECPICNRACPNERALTSHISTVHSATKAFSCPTCDARYSSRKSLVRHIRSHTIAPQPKLAVCHICGNSFKGKSKLNRHLREVCEKDKLEEELLSYYDHQNIL